MTDKETLRGRLSLQLVLLAACVTVVVVSVSFLQEGPARWFIGAGAIATGIVALVNVVRLSAAIGTSKKQ